MRPHALLPLLLAFATPATGQPMMRGSMTPPPPFDAAARREVVTHFAQVLRNRYVFPDVGARAAARIEAALAAGDYESLADPVAFTARLDTDVAAIAHDKHMHVFPLGVAPPPPAAAPAGPIPKGEAGITRADRLPGDIGYIEVVGFPPPIVFKPALDRAMAALRGSRALILDARRNGGGAPASVSYLISYLLAGTSPVEINDIVRRVPDSTNFVRDAIRSTPTPLSFAGMPTIVLTSRTTFSGGEELAYDAQSLKLATIIGEVTGGGANPTGGVPLGHAVVALIPFARAESPITHTNWEGRGVQPDIVVPADQALAIALQRLGQKPVADIAAASQAQLFAPRTVARPGAEAAVRRLIEALASPSPDYAALTADPSSQARQSLIPVHEKLATMGALRSITFREPDLMGGDDFTVEFAEGTLTLAFILDDAGRIVAMNMPM